MPCCGGKKAGTPISRAQYVAGRVLFAQIRIGVSVGLHGAGLASGRMARIASFWDALSADWARSIAAREGIIVGRQNEASCPIEGAPPSHVAVGATDDELAADFGGDWDDAWVDDEAPPASPDAA
jgi:hypothetical protein